MLTIVNRKQLMSMGRCPEAPFSMMLHGYDTPLVVQTILRILPGKRLTALATWNDLEVVVKLFFDPFRAQQKCLTEHKGYHFLQQLNVPVPRILYKGRCQHQAKNVFVFVFERLIPSDNIDAILIDPNANQKRRTLLFKMTELLVRLHQSGLFLKDLHPQNFIKTKKDLFFIDIADYRLFKKPLTQQLCVKNLGLLLSQIAPLYDELIQPIFKYYCQKKNIPYSDRQLNLLKKWQQYYRLKREHQKQKKIFRNSTQFIQQVDQKKFWVCDRDYYTSEMQRCLSNPDLAIRQGKIIKAGNTCTVAQVEIDGRLFVLKRYNIKSAAHQLKRAISESRASKSWKNAHRLLDYQILTPKPIAFIERRFGPFRKQAYIITEYVSGELACDYLHRHARNNSKISLVQKWFLGIMNLLSQLGLSHGDMKASNFIISDDQIYLIDLDSMRRFRSKASLKRAILNDRQRFLENFVKLQEG